MENFKKTFKTIKKAPYDFEIHILFDDAFETKSFPKEKIPQQLDLGVGNDFQN